MNYSKLDKKWGQAVKEEWGNACPHCGYDNPTCTPAHIIGRNNKRTRLVKQNGIWACDHLHRLMEKSEEFKKQVVKFYVNKNRYEELLKVSRGLNKPEDFGFEVIK
jgi:hypothetical protein